MNLLRDPLSQAGPHQMETDAATYPLAKTCQPVQTLASVDTSRCSSSASCHFPSTFASALLSSPRLLSMQSVIVCPSSSSSLTADLEYISISPQIPTRCWCADVLLHMFHRMFEDKKRVTFMIEKCCRSNTLKSLKI